MEYIKNRNLTGQKFNCLIANAYTGKSHPKEGRYWLCSCDCGKEITVSTQRLRSGATKHCGCSRNYNTDLTGKKINFLQVNKKISVGLYECECECGEKLHIQGRQLIQGRIRSCGCKTKQLRWCGCGELSGTFWARIVSNAKQRGIDLNITIKEAWDKYIEQDGNCALSGLRITFAENLKKHRIGHNTASLDRINSKLPYTKDNIQWLHKNVNIMKQSLDQSEFIYLCRKIGEYSNG